MPARPARGQAIAFEAVVHAHRGVGMAELEPAAPPGEQPDWMQKVGDTIEALRGADDLDDLVARIAQRVKRLTRFDRVMVYRFDEHWNGHVIADAREPDMESFFDLHYPASDIPAQARELFHRNLVRYIAAVAHDPVPVLPWLDSERQQPLDMSHAMLRSVSPIHLKYLGNLGVGASLALSILVDDRLWGLVACHHRAPHRVPVRLRHACHALAVTTGYMVGWQLQRERAAANASLAHARTRIVEAFNHVQAPLADAIEQASAPLQRIAGATGGALRLHGQPARDRAEFVVELGGEPMVDPHGRITGWHGTITDTTYEVAIQAALRQKEAAEISSLAKSRFLAQMSHELRTPLNAVLGFVQLLLMDDGISHTQRDRLQHIRRAGDWLLEMICDLMDLSQIETGHLTLKMGAVDARVVIAETIALVGAQAIATEVRLLGAPGGAPVWVVADPSRLRQVLVNLTSNALKYNRIHGEVRLEVQPDAVAGRTRIEVCDTGVGMTPAQIGQLFEPFNRLGREFLGIQGSGIGLVIARQLIEAMGGGISVESEVGRGSTFAVTLADAAPVAASPPTGGAITAAREAAPDRAVLYVGDDASNVVLVQSIVEELPGCRLVQVDSAERGFQLTRELAPAVVLIDIRHAGQPGLRLLRSIKADPATRHIRCIAVNASAKCETLEELQGAGFEDRWAKPIDLKVISADLKAALSR